MHLITKAQCYEPSYWNALTYHFTSLEHSFFFLTNVVKYNFQNAQM